MTQGRFLRAAEYYALRGDKGALCVVQAQLIKSHVLIAPALATTAADDALPLWLEAQRLVAECRRILNARLSANTCLVGRCFAAEEDFYARYKVMMLKLREGLFAELKAAWSAKGGVKREVGYEVCMEAAFYGLRFAYPGLMTPLALCSDLGTEYRPVFRSHAPSSFLWRRRVESFMEETKLTKDIFSG